MVSTTVLRDLARSNRAWPVTGIAASRPRRSRVRDRLVDIAVQAADRASEMANPTTTRVPVRTPSTA
jgi:hypothetical protein